MNVKDINSHLIVGNFRDPGALPHLQDLMRSRIRLEINFGLNTLPQEPGVIVVRGARQLGKSTWLESQIARSIEDFGIGTALYLNGDEIGSYQQLMEAVRNTIKLFRKEAKVKRLFIDEISVISDWQKAIKRLADTAEIKDILLVTTGSSAADLRRGVELLPGRKGKLTRTSYIFTHIPYREFEKVWKASMDTDALVPYMLSGGCPIAIRELIENQKISPNTDTLVRDWVFGECAKSGRNRASLLAIFEVLFRNGGNSVGYAKLARDTGLANNTVASGYIELLSDILGVVPCLQWNPKQAVYIRRKECKFHFINLLMATIFSPFAPRTTNDFLRMPEKEQGKWYEWQVASELWRRQAVAGHDVPDLLGFWKQADQEMDFIVTPNLWLEVKRGQASPHEFVKIKSTFPKVELKAICTNDIQTEAVESISMQESLLNERF